MTYKILFVLIILTAFGGAVLAQKYADFVAFELCTRTEGHSRDHEPLYIRKSSVRVVTEVKGRPDCTEIAAVGNYNLRVYGSVAETIKKLELEDE